MSEPFLQSQAVSFPVATECGRVAAGKQHEVSGSWGMRGTAKKSITGPSVTGNRQGAI